jgi:hypothetical protein
VSDEAVTRRQFLLRVVAVASASAAAACSKARAEGLVCTDTTGLSPTDVAARAAAGYVDRAPDPAHACESCQQFIEPSDGCGRCKLLHGAIHPLGTCRVFAPRG